MMNPRQDTPRCAACGKFVKPGARGTTYHFQPDNEFGPELHEWLCPDCTKKELAR